MLRGNRSETAPDTAVLSGDFVKLSVVLHAEARFTEWRLACATCGRRFRVVDDTGYWKPLYQWMALPG